MGDSVELVRSYRVVVAECPPAAREAVYARFVVDRAVELAARGVPEEGLSVLMDDEQLRREVLAMAAQGRRRGPFEDLDADRVVADVGGYTATLSDAMEKYLEFLEATFAEVLGIKPPKHPGARTWRLDAGRLLLKTFPGVHQASISSSSSVVTQLLYKRPDGYLSGQWDLGDCGGHFGYFGLSLEGPRLRRLSYWRRQEATIRVEDLAEPILALAELAVLLRTEDGRQEFDRYCASAGRAAVALSDQMDRLGYLHPAHPFVDDG